MAAEYRRHWVTAAFLALLIIAALTAHTAALTITTSDTVELSTKGESGWDKLSSGDLSTKTITKAEPVKLTFTSEKEKLEPILQLNPSASLLVKANYQGKEISIVQASKSRIEGYYSYGKSTTYPWGFYWCVHLGERPMLIYSEFSKRSTWYNPVSQKTIDNLNAAIDRGVLPDISIIQAAVGA